ncbi:hypothetical protein [Isoptericola sp. NPDC057559]|uniref:hypothetical protein n=1 Tax=Isoptericola sp. NPDC057559 TaxID=3346168 RepID=UPI0036C437EE
MRDEVDPNPTAPWSRRLSVTAGDGERVEPSDGYRVVVVDTASSGEVRDLASYRRDLELARVYATESGRHDPGEFPDGHDPRLAFWLAAIVCYGRAFNSGVRKYRIDTADLDESRLEAHKYFLDLRNKHAAHAVNDFEQTFVIAYLTDSAFARRAVTRTGQAHIEYHTATENDLATLVQLCDHLVKVINRRLESLQSKIGLELAQMGEEAVYALPDLVMPSPQRERVAKRRR